MAGFARELSTDGVSTPEEIDSGGFDLTAEIDDVGELVSGTLSITGTIASLGFESGTLLTGDLTDFGFPTGGGSILEFTFDVTGGDLEAEYDGRSGGIIAGGTGFGGSFDSDFDNLMMGIGGTGTGSSNTAPIPEPGTLALLSAALGGLAYVGRRRA